MSLLRFAFNAGLAEREELGVEHDSRGSSSSRTYGVAPNIFPSLRDDLMSRVRCAASSRLHVGGGVAQEVEAE